MVEYKCGSPRRFPGSSFIHFFQQGPESVRIEPGARHQTHCHKTRFQFLISAVPQERSINTERNAKFAQLLFPCLGGRQTGCNRNRRLYDELPGKLGRTVARRDMSDLMGENGGQLVVARCDLKHAPIDIDGAAWETQGVYFLRIDNAESVPQGWKRMVLDQTLSYCPEIDVKVWVFY